MGSDLFWLRRVSTPAERSDPFAREAGNWGMSPFPFWRSLALGCAALSCQRFVCGHPDRASLNEPPRSTCRASPRAAPLEFPLDGIPARTGALEIEPRPLLLAHSSKEQGECPHYCVTSMSQRVAGSTGFTRCMS